MFAPPAGVEPAIPGMKTQCPRPLDDGGVLCARLRVLRYYHDRCLIALHIHKTMAAHLNLKIIHESGLDLKKFSRELQKSSLTCKLLPRKSWLPR